MIEQFLERWNDFASRANSTLDTMNIANRVMMEYEKNFPNAAAEIHAAWGCMMPIVMTVPPHLYEIHCRELAQRAVKGEDMEPGTDAEIMWAITNEAMDKHKVITNEETAALVEMFRRHFPEVFDSMVDEEVVDAVNTLAMNDVAEVFAERWREKTAWPYRRKIWEDNYKFWVTEGGYKERFK